MKKAIFFDLDNTIYDVRSVADEMLSSLYALIEKNGEYEGDFEEIKDDITRKPLQTIAKENGFSERLLNECIDHLKDLEYLGEMRPFEDFETVKELETAKFLVTSGFTKMQMSKVRAMKLDNLFKEIIVADFLSSDKSKKDIFSEIIGKYNYRPSEILVVGDDLHSEIQAAKDLGVDYVLLDKRGIYHDLEDENKITGYDQLKRFL